VSKDEKDDFDHDDEDDLFSNPDEQEQDYQFDQEEKEASSETISDYDLDEDDEEDDEDDDDEDNDDSLKGRLQQQIHHFIKMVTEEEPKKVLVPVAIAIVAFIVVIFGFVKFVGLFTADPKQEQQLITTAAKTAPTTNLPPATEPQKVDSGTLPVVSHEDDKPIDVLASRPEVDKSQQLLQKAVAAQSAFDKQLSTLQGNYDEVREQLNRLAQQTAQNSAQMNNISRNVQTLESQMMKLNNVLLDLLKEAKQQKATEAQSVDHQGQVKGSQEGTTELRYYIQAIIPGRAWLKDSNGKIFTVTTGDGIPGYGTVIKIEPKKGLISTDQGRVIEYGIDQF
jgi:intracellular multiplication protein IcmG